MSHRVETSIKFESEAAFIEHTKKLAMLKPGDVFYALGEDGKPTTLVFTGWDDEDGGLSAKGYFWDIGQNVEINLAGIGIGLIFFTKEECAAGKLIVRQ